MGRGVALFTPLFQYVLDWLGSRALNVVLSGWGVGG